MIFAAKTSDIKSKIMIIRYIGSPNYDQKTNRKVKYLIIHYTGMKSQQVAVKRLQSKVAKVSCHYLISKTGFVYQMVKDQNIAWHAGKSKWRKDKNLNSSSLGIELVNNGKEKFPKKQINSLIKLIIKLKKKHKIKIKNVLGHEDIAPGRKFDPGPLFPWGLLNKNKLSKKC